jgi:hypothetical protein
VAWVIAAQGAIAQYLEHGDYDRYLRSLRRELASLQSLMVSAVHRYFPKGTSMVKPPGGFYLWGEFPEGVNVVRLFEMAEASGIAIAPGAMFSRRSEFRRRIYAAVQLAGKGECHSAPLRRERAGSGVCKKPPPRHLSNSYAGRQPKAGFITRRVYSDAMAEGSR